MRTQSFTRPIDIKRICITTPNKKRRMLNVFKASLTLIGYIEDITMSPEWYFDRLLPIENSSFPVSHFVGKGWELKFKTADNFFPETYAFYTISFKTDKAKYKGKARFIEGTAEESTDIVIGTFKVIGEGGLKVKELK